MVNAGEKVTQTVRREFMEEAGNLADEQRRQQHKQMVENLFAGGRVVYEGYVDEPRNTDHAWLETTVFHFHCSAVVGRLLPLNAGDDATAVRWLDIGPDNPQLYPPHRGWVSKVAGWGRRARRRAH